MLIDPQGTADVTFIVARAVNGVIGREGGLPWHIPADLRRFKRLTMGSAMVMGRRTFESLPGLLTGRRHIVLTRDPAWAAPGAEVARDPDAAIAMAAPDPVTVIGGAEIFALLMPHATRIELTEVHGDIEGDTFMSAPDPREWRETFREEHPAEDGRPAFAFVTLVRA